MRIENVILQWILSIGVFATLAATVYYSLRYRRSEDRKTRGMLSARMNIAMGVMLILLALIQMLLFAGSTLRVIVGAVFLLLGLFNLFAGLRNHSVYRSLK